MEELMTKNFDAFLKLEELMYLSLVAKFDYIHTCDGKTYICFTCIDENINKDVKLKPIYITSLENVSERVSKSRINAFEKKIFNDNFIEFLNRTEDGENCKLCFSRRIKDYINNVYTKGSAEVQKSIVSTYKNNFCNLKNEKILDENQFEAGIEFVSRQLVKVNEKTN